MEILDFLNFFKTSLFWSKKHSYLSRISKNNVFWLNLPKKYQWENIRFFHKNHGLTLSQISFFLTFLKHRFSGVNSILFYPEHKKTTLFLLNLSKKWPWENIQIFEKKHGPTPLENFDFSDFLKISLFWSKKHSLPSTISKKNLFWLNLPKKYQWENIRFFHKNHGLTLSQISFFLTFLKHRFSGVNSILFYPEHKKTTLFLLNLSKKWPWENIQIFEKKHGPTPLENVDFSDFLKISLFWSKNILFHQEYQKTIISGLIWPKKYLWKISIFWIFLKRHFSRLKSILFYPK